LSIFLSTICIKIIYAYWISAVITMWLKILKYKVIQRQKTRQRLHGSYNSENNWQKQNNSLASNWPVIHWDQAFLAPRDNLEDLDLPESYISSLQRRYDLTKAITYTRQGITNISIRQRTNRCSIRQSVYSNSSYDESIICYSLCLSVCLSVWKLPPTSRVTRAARFVQKCIM